MDWKDSLNLPVSAQGEWAAKRFSGDSERAARYLPVAYALLGEVKNRMAYGGVGFGSRQVTLPDGTRIRVLRDGERNIVDIRVPPPVAEIPVIISPQTDCVTYADYEYSVLGDCYGDYGGETCQREETWYFPRLSTLYSQQHRFGLNIYIPFAYYDFANGNTWWSLTYQDGDFFYWINGSNTLYDYENDVIKISYYIDDWLPTPIKLKFNYYYYYEGEPPFEIVNDIVFEFCLEGVWNPCS